MKVNKKKCLYITNLYPNPWEKNKGIFNYHFILELKKNIEIDTLISISIFNLKKFLKIKKNEKAGFFLFIYTPRILRSIYSVFYFCSIFFQKYRHIKRNRYSHILISWAYPDGVAGALISRMLGVPYIIKVHGSDVNIQLKSLSRRIQSKWAMNNSLAVITVSNALKNQLIEYGVNRDKITTIYNGVNHSIFNYSNKLEYLNSKLGEDKKNILFVGNLKKDKGIYELLESFIKIYEKDNSLCLYIIGKGTEKSNLESKITNRLKECVFLLGELNQDQIATWYRTVDVLCLPSYNEGVPNVLLEAMSCGLPVVATRVGGIPEIINSNNGLLINNPAEVGQKIIEALSVNWDKRKISQLGNQYTWEKNSELTRGLLY